MKNTQTHLGLFLDAKFIFLNIEMEKKKKKVVKGISVIKKLSKTLPCSSQLINYISFITPHLDYGDVIYDQPNNGLSGKIESINVMLPIRHVSSPLWRLV